MQYISYANKVTGSLRAELWTWYPTVNESMKKKLKEAFYESVEHFLSNKCPYQNDFPQRYAKSIKYKLTQIAKAYWNEFVDEYDTFAEFADGIGPSSYTTVCNISQWRNIKSLIDSVTNDFWIGMEKFE